MRIAFLAWESLHSVPVGGVARHVTELAAALQRRGHEVHVFTRVGEGQSPYGVYDGVHYHRCPMDLCPDFVSEMNNMCNSFMYFLRQVEAHQGVRVRHHPRPRLALRQGRGPGQEGGVAGRS